MDAKPAEPQPVNSSVEDEERKARREAVLQRQRELQQKSQSTLTPWESSLNRNANTNPLSANEHSKPSAISSPVQTSSNFNNFVAQQSSPDNFAPNSFAQAQSGAIAGREDFIRNAVEFLSDARVATSPVEKKINFLKSKGLTQGEIDEAMRRTATTVPHSTTPLPMSPQVPHRPLARVAQSPVHIIAQIPWKALAFVLIICAGIGGAISWLLKKYVFPSSSNKIALEQEETVKTLQKKIDDVNAQLEKQSEELKNTLHFVHSFMLNRRDYTKNGETLRAIIDDVTDTSSMSYYHNPHRLPDSPFVQNFPDLKSNLIYAKQIISTATNTSLLDIPKREKPVAQQSNGLASSLSGSLMNGNNLSLGLPQHLNMSSKNPLANSSQNKPLANSANKANMNWLYNNSSLRTSQQSSSIAAQIANEEAKEKVAEVSEGKQPEAVEKAF